MSGVETKILSQLEVNAIRPEQSWAVPPIVLGPGNGPLNDLHFT